GEQRLLLATGDARLPVAQPEDGVLPRLVRGARKVALDAEDGQFVVGLAEVHNGSVVLLFAKLGDLSGCHGVTLPPGEAGASARTALPRACTNQTRDGLASTSSYYMERIAGRCVCRCRRSRPLLHRLLEHSDTRPHVVGRLGGVVLVLDGDHAVELDLAQGGEDGRHVEDALAVDDVALGLVVVVL